MPTKEHPVTIIEGDCLVSLRGLPDGCADAVLTDPPYGLKWVDNGFLKKNLVNKDAANSWDARPSRADLDLIRSKAPVCVIWGGNYFAGDLGDFRAPLVWDKKTGNNSFADGEMAWTSFDTGTLRIFRHQWCGAFRDSERGEKNVHPTQKPVALMRWCIQQLPAGCDVILDPFAGSGTTGVAAVLEGRRAILIEKEPAYVEIIRRRIAHALEQERTALFPAHQARPLPDAPKIGDDDMWKAKPKK